MQGCSMQSGSTATGVRNRFLMKAGAHLDGHRSDCSEAAGGVMESLVPSAPACSSGQL